MTDRSRSLPTVLAIGALALGLATAQAEARGTGIMPGADWPVFGTIEGVEDGALDRDAFRALIEARIAERRDARQGMRADRRAAQQGARLDALVDHLMAGASDGVLDADALRAGLEAWTAEQRTARESRRSGMDERSGRGQGQRAERAKTQRQGAGEVLPERAVSRLFRFFDTDGDGRISEAEYEDTLARLEARAVRGEGRGKGRGPWR